MQIQMQIFSGILYDRGGILGIYCLDLELWKKFWNRAWVYDSSYRLFEKVAQVLLHESCMTGSQMHDLMTIKS